MPKTKTAPAPPVQEKQQPQSLQYDINIYPSKGDSKQKASVTVNIGGQFAIRGLKIMDGINGLFVSMPSYKAGNGEYKDLFFPCTKESRAAFDKAVLDAYRQTMAQSQTAAEQAEAPAPQQEQTQQGMAAM